MKEFIDGMATAFATVAAYKVIQGCRKKEHENHIRDVSSEMCDNTEDQTNIPTIWSESSDKDGFYYGKNIISGNDILFDRKHSHSPNGLIIGRAGSGKSWAAVHEITQVLDKTDDSIIIIEKEGYYSQDERIKDRVTTISPYDSNSEYHINPLDVYITEYDDIHEKVTACDIADRAVTLFEEILCRSLTNAEKSVITAKTKELFIPFVKHLKEKELKCDYEHNPTFSDIAELLLSEKETWLSAEFYIKESVIKECFSYETNMPSDRAVVLSWKDTPHYLNSALYSGCVMYSWNRLQRSCEEQKYSWIYLEDIDSLLYNKIESTLSLVFELFKRSRPYGGIVTMIAQSVEKLRKTEPGNACLVSAGFIRCLSFNGEDHNSFSGVFGLQDDVLGYICNAPVGNGLLIASGHVIPFDIKHRIW